MVVIKKFGFDLCRIIAAILVVAIHVYPFTSINDTFNFMFTNVFCRIAVPIFLMITGYYVIDKSLDDKSVLIKYTKKILFYYLICILLYIPLNIYTGYFHNLSLGRFIKDILIDGTIYHLWYFPALITGIWISYGLLKKFNMKVTLIITSILYLIGLFGDSYYGLISNVVGLKEFYNIIFMFMDYTRNGLFFTPIFFILGFSFKKKEIDIKPSILYIGAIVVTLLMLGEGYILNYYNIQKHTSMYIFLIPLMYLLFKIILNNNNYSSRRIRTISTLIYIIHPYIIVVVRLISKILHLDKVFINNSLLNYFWIVLFSFIFTYIIDKIFKSKIYENIRIRFISIFKNIKIFNREKNV